MAVGDTVLVIGAISTILEFRPAAGVSVMLTTIGGGSAGSWIRYMDTSGTAITYLGETNSTWNFGHNIKMIVDNNQWLAVNAPASSQKATACGIQIV
tara:strand:- start:77 stop:367 length:291 start_codon:yes stop_codon:yes gene_type:complete